MAKNTGRRSRASASPQRARGDEWIDVLGANRDWVVWAEPEGVVIYEGEKEWAQRRHVFTPAVAERLAELLCESAKEVREL